jgi:DAK2 domain fusion protein YloV
MEMFGSASAWLERNAAHINSLNVYPVPDGDTGINMLLTMRSAVAEASRADDDSASTVVRAIAHGALMGARGNSGVILSQILRGLAVPLDGKELLEGGDLAEGLAAGSELAYKAVSHPVEGTILTVIREASTAARGASATNDLCAILEATAAAAKDTVARTPSMLSVLREAGVVDAGGLGLYVILEGLLRHLRGDVDECETGGTISAAHLEVNADGEEHCYGYCTEFMIEGQGLSPSAIRGHLEDVGESVLVVADEDFVRAHVHTPDPDAVLEYASSLGKLHQVKVQNMDEQHEDFITMEGRPKAGTATVAVASGQGMEEVFRSLGVSVVVPGGPTMNPSTEELLRAVRAVAADRVVILPNDPNIVLTANQVCGLSDKQVAIVPTKTIPQGVAAILALGSDDNLEDNVAAMERAASAVRTVEITAAVRSSKVGDLVMEKGQAIALLDGELVAVADHIPQLVDDVLSGMDLSGSEIITVYHGADTDSAEAGELAESLRRRYPHLEVEPIFGGQPHYNYIISVE